MSRSTCDELGVCKDASPRCDGCTQRPVLFAPGVVEVYRRNRLGTPAKRRELWRCLRVALLLCLVASAAGLVTGLVAGYVL